MEARRQYIYKERIIDIEFKISRLGILGKAYYDLALIKLRRHRKQISIARTQNSLLHAALDTLREQDRIARKNAGDLENLRKKAATLRLQFDHQRERVFKRHRKLEWQITGTHSAELDCAGVLDPNTPPELIIRSLECKISHVQLKIQGVQILVKQYEATVKPLRDEWIVYDSKLAALQEHLKIKTHECELLINTHHDAIRARDAAKLELEEELIAPDLRLKILKAIKEIKSVMDVGSMREMFHQYLVQEKQSAYLETIYEDMKRQLELMREDDSVPRARRKSSIKDPHYASHVIDGSKMMVRRQSDWKGSFPLIQILEGTQRLVDKLHAGQFTITSDQTIATEVIENCRQAMIKILQALHRQLKRKNKEAVKRAEFEAKQAAHWAKEEAEVARKKKAAEDARKKYEERVAAREAEIVAAEKAARLQMSKASSPSLPSESDDENLPSSQQLSESQSRGDHDATEDSTTVQAVGTTTAQHPSASVPSSATNEYLLSSYYQQAKEAQLTEETTVGSPAVIFLPQSRQAAASDGTVAAGESTTPTVPLDQRRQEISSAVALGLTHDASAKATSEFDAGLASPASPCGSPPGDAAVARAEMPTLSPGNEGEAKSLEAVEVGPELKATLAAVEGSQPSTVPTTDPPIAQPPPVALASAPEGSVDAQQPVIMPTGEVPGPLVSPTQSGDLKAQTASTQNLTQLPVGTVSHLGSEPAAGPGGPPEPAGKTVTAAAQVTESTAQPLPMPEQAVPPTVEKTQSSDLAPAAQFHEAAKVVEALEPEVKSPSVETVSSEQVSPIGEPGPVSGIASPQQLGPGEAIALEVPSKDVLQEAATTIEAKPLSVAATSSSPSVAAAAIGPSIPISDGGHEKAPDQKVEGTPAAATIPSVVQSPAEEPGHSIAAQAAAARPSDGQTAPGSPPAAGMAMLGDQKVVPVPSDHIPTEDVHIPVAVSPGLPHTVGALSDDSRSQTPADAGPLIPSVVPIEATETEATPSSSSAEEHEAAAETRPSPGAAVTPAEGLPISPTEAPGTAAAGTIVSSGSKGVSGVEGIAQTPRLSEASRLPRSPSGAPIASGSKIPSIEISSIDESLPQRPGGGGLRSPNMPRSPSGAPVATAPGFPFGEGVDRPKSERSNLSEETSPPGSSGTGGSPTDTARSLTTAPSDSEKGSEPGAAGM